jgi:hypothetical protein
MTRFHLLRGKTRLQAAAIGALIIGSLTLTTSSAPAGGFRTVPAPPPVPTRAGQIQNIDQVKTSIKGYYGDTTTAQVDPVDNSIDNGDKALHQFSPTSSYAEEVAGIVTSAERVLGTRAALRKPQRAVLFDVDDTTLNTYSYEIYSNFVYNPGTNAAFVNACQTTGCVFPAVPHMVDLEHFAIDHGYAVFFLTGRPGSAANSQKPGTLANLTAEGYDVDADHVYLKDPAAPWLSSCSDGTTITCSTTEYKSLTRKHIESLGFDILANFGDQFSDLNGGYADRTYKIPNPTYYLP